jgi:hypothetical protein
MNTNTLTPLLLQRIDAYWRAANYLSVGQIYLFDNPLLKRPLALADVKRMGTQAQRGESQKLSSPTVRSDFKNCHLQRPAVDSSDGSFEPDLNFVAIRLGHVSVREAGSELATTEQSPSGAFHLGDGTVDVVGVHEPKAEMCDAPTETGGGGVLDKGDDVVPAGSLSPSPRPYSRRPKACS